MTRPISIHEAKQMRAERTQRERPVLREEAYHGPLGDAVALIRDETEADPAAILAQLLAAFGVLCGRGPTMRIGATPHHAALNVLVVGESGWGAKGDGWGIARYFLTKIDPNWEDRQWGGLYSGEGLIEHLSDPAPDDDSDDPDAEPAPPIDKRKLVVETEFGSKLKRAKNPGNTVSHTVRQIFDGGRLQTLTRSSTKLMAEGYHVGICAHITPAELAAELEHTEVRNGLINRFVVVWSQRQRFIAFPSDLEHIEWAGPVEQLRSAADVARRLAPTDSDWEMFTAEARAHYEPIHPYLQTGRRDMGDSGDAVGRGAPLVKRIALIYALADKSYDGNQLRITDEHLTAALALWDFAAESAAYVFGAREFDPMAAKAEKAISFLQEAAPDGIKQSIVGQKVFGNNAKREQMEDLRRYMEEAQLVNVRTIPTPGGGRPPTYWYLREGTELAPSFPRLTPPPATAGNGSTERGAEIYPINPLNP